MKFRHVLSWKSWYYKVVLPGLRRLGPEACDSALTLFGRAIARANSQQQVEIARAVHRANEILGAGWDESRTAESVASNLARFSARDYPLDGVADQDVLDRFEIDGAEHLDAALATDAAWSSSGAIWAPTSRRSTGSIGEGSRLDSSSSVPDMSHKICTHDLMSMPIIRNRNSFSSGR